MIAALFSVLLLASDTPATGTEAASAPTQSTPLPAAPPAKTVVKKICRTDESDTGSRMRKKVCFSQTEWDKREAGKSVGDLKTIGGR